MKHTPGLWKVSADKHGVFIMAGNGYCVGSTADVRTSSDCRKHPTAIGNAHLMAAAPELLEACKEALQVMKKYADVPAHVLALEQAIAKAECGSL